MADYSNIAQQVKSAFEDQNGGGIIPLIPEDEKSATHMLKFLSGKVDTSKNGKLMAVFECKIWNKEDKDSPEHGKKENLYYVFGVNHQFKELLRVMSWLEFDFERIDDKWIDADWKKVFDEMEDYEGNIFFPVLFTRQKDFDEKKPRYNKRVINGEKGEDDHYDMGIEWPVSKKKKKSKPAPTADIEVDDEDV